MTQAGVLIINQAESTFIDGSASTPVKIMSNQSSVIVGESIRLNLEQDQQKQAAPGQQVFLSTD